MRKYSLMVVMVAGIFIFPGVVLAETFDFSSPVYVSGTEDGMIIFDSDDSANLDLIDGIMQFHNITIQSQGRGFLKNNWRPSPGKRNNPKQLKIQLYKETLETQFSFNIKHGSKWGLIPSLNFILKGEGIVMECSEAGCCFSLIAHLKDPAFYKAVEFPPPKPASIASKETPVSEKAADIKKPRNQKSDIGEAKVKNTTSLTESTDSEGQASIEKKVQVSKKAESTPKKVEPKILPDEFESVEKIDPSKKGVSVEEKEPAINLPGVSVKAASEKSDLVESKKGKDINTAKSAPPKKEVKGKKTWVDLFFSLLLWGCILFLFSLLIFCLILFWKKIKKGSSRKSGRSDPSEISSHQPEPPETDHPILDLEDLDDDRE